MNAREIADIVGSFGAAKWMSGTLPGLPGEGWFLLEVSPLPPGDEIGKVVADIENDRPVLVKNGQVRHLSSCNEDHSLSIPTKWPQDWLARLRNNKYKLAVHPGISGWYQAQPLAIVFDPVLNYEVFPDHPHLNVGGLQPHSKGKVFLPDTVCYEEDISSLSPEPVARFKQTFAYLSIWLLRHMIWEETRKYNGIGCWIGPEGSSLPLRERAKVWNPAGPCRCGNGKRYMNCHMDIDRGALFPLSTGAALQAHCSKQDAISAYSQRRSQHAQFYPQLQRLVLNVRW